MTDNVVEFRKATKLYAGVPAIQDVDFALRRGEIHALAHQGRPPGSAGEAAEV